MIVKKYRKGFPFKKDYYELNGVPAVIEHNHNIFNVRFENRRIEFFKARSMFTSKYFVGRHKYIFKGIYFIKNIESRGIIYHIKYEKPYWRLYAGDHEIAKFFYNQRNYGDITMVSSDHEYNQVISELAIAISMKLVANKTILNQLTLIALIVLYQFIY